MSHPPFDFQSVTFNKCPHCKKFVEPDWSYCSHCGNSLKFSLNSEIFPEPINFKKNLKFQDRELTLKSDPCTKYCPHCFQTLVSENRSLPSLLNELDSRKENVLEPLNPKIEIDPSLKIKSHKVFQLQQEETDFGLLNKFEKKYCPKCGQNLESRRESCFIVTACNADVETLNVFYDFRDKILLNSLLGRNCVKFYYQVSPTIANTIQSSKLLQKLVLLVLLKPLSTALAQCLQAMEDSRTQASLNREQETGDLPK